MKKKSILALMATLIVSILLSMIPIISASSSESLDNIKNKDIKAVLKDTMIFAEGAPTAIIYGDQLPLADNSARKVALKQDGDLYIPSDFVKECGVSADLESTSIQNTNYVSVNAIAEVIGAKCDEYDGLWVIAKDDALDKKAYDNRKDIITLFGVFVSPDADSSGTGTFARPVKTIDQAKSKVKANMQTIGWLGDEYTVYLRGGIYMQTESIKFTADDSGTDDCTIVYDSYPGENPQIKGGISVTGADFRKVEKSDSAYAKLPDDAKGNVYMIDLAPYGLKPSTGNPNTQMIVYNGEQQTLARWPNHTTAKTTDVIRAKATVDDQSSIFEIEDTYKIATWAEAAEPWIQANFNYTWHTTYHPVEFDVQNGYVDTVTNTFQSISKNKPYFIYNLIEELDFQSEYYIDRKNCVMYFYPYKADIINGKFLTNEVEIALLTSPVIDVQAGASNISFRRLDISLSKNYGISTNIDSHDISVLGCKIHHTSETGAWMEGTNIKLHSCDVYDTYGVHVRGGNREKAEISGNEITNNRIFRARTGIDEHYYDSVGEIVTNNEISRATHQAVGGMSMLSHTDYNEIYDNSTNKVADSGTIYSYHQTFRFGETVSYNYIHDGWTCMAQIYQDGGSSGATCVGNIMYRTSRPVFCHGPFNNHFEKNIFIDQMHSKYGDQAVMITTADVDNPVSWDPETGVQLSGHTQYGSTWIGVMKNVDKDIWKTMAPNVWEFWLGGKLQYLEDITVKDNISVNAGDYQTGKDAAKTVTPENNHQIATPAEAGFVDYENQNFNLREDSVIYKLVPDMQKIDYMDKIGVYTDEYRPELPEFEQDFGLLLPYNQEKGVNPDEISFKWEQCDATRQYRFELATDPEFKNVIRDEYVDGNVYTVVGLRYGGERYYWRVRLVNTRHAMLYPNDAECMCNVPYFSFTTQLEEDIDTTQAYETYESFLTKGDEIVEGTEPGQYFAGTKDFYNEKMTAFKEFLDNGGYTQREVNKKLTKFKSDINGINGKRNSETILMNDALMNIMDWNTQMNVTVGIEGGGIRFERASDNDSTSFGYKTKIENYQMIKFDAEFNFAERGWMYFGIRSDKTNGSYSDNQFYFIGLNPGYGLELQRWNTSIYLNKNWWGADDWKPVSGKRYTIEMGALDTEDGNVRIIFKVDGVTMIDYLDDSDAKITRNGYFTVGEFNLGTVVKILPTAE